MAAITIRTLPDEVVDALKQRAKRNSRSMEAEVRDVLTRIAQGEELSSGIESYAAGQLRNLEAAFFAPRAVSHADLMARMAANPAPPVDGEAWLADARADDDSEDYRDPWAPRAAS